MIELKTGYLFGLSSAIGSMCSKKNVYIYSKFKEFGSLLGKAFQIQDDLLEIYSDNKIMGKNLKSDILLNKKTFLMISANRQCKNEIELAIKLCNNDFSKGINAIRTLLIDNRIKDKTEKLISNTVEEAKLILSSINIQSNDLLYLSNIVLKRYN